MCVWMMNMKIMTTIWHGSMENREDILTGILKGMPMMSMATGAIPAAATSAAA